MTTFTSRLALAALALGLSVAGLGAQQVTKQEVAGIKNFARLETTIACGGSTAPEAIAELRKMGFTSVFNLRMADEPGNDLAGEEAAAKAAGMRFIHIPFDVRKADPAVADQFLAEIAKPGAQPAYIHCAGGGRAAAVWLIKRVLVDKWDLAKATKEAEDLGLAAAVVREYALGYITAHTK
ncbi:MAG: sulfur transferase domain-containing protein [Vicinamibacterales bacterium]|nr:sulfur transferase domain-containing protein [Vicinamibacterales bacterium]